MINTLSPRETGAAASMNLVPDPWLAKHVGYSVFRVAQADGSTTLASDFFDAARALPAAFLHAKIPSHDVAAFTALQDAGFYVIDSLVVFERPHGVAFPATSKARCNIRLAEADHEASVCSLAKTAIQGSRFHLDPHIDTVIARTINEAWMADYFTHSRGDYVIIATDLADPHRVVGFLGVMHTTDASNTTDTTCKLAVTDLIGVDPAYHRSGIASALMQRQWEISVRRGDKGMRVGTQISNLPAICLYETLGFRLISSYYVLHAHMRDGRLLRATKA